MEWGGFKNCWSVEECFDTAMLSNVSAIQARRADTSSAGSREAPVCLERTLKRPERPTQTGGKHEGSLSELADSNCVDPAGLLLLRSLR